MAVLYPLSVYTMLKSHVFNNSNDVRRVSIREWSLITGRGGLQNGRGGAREVLPLRKGGAEKVLAMLKGGHKKFWGRLYAVA